MYRNELILHELDVNFLKKACNLSKTYRSNIESQFLAFGHILTSWFCAIVGHKENFLAFLL